MLSIESDPAVMIVDCIVLPASEKLCQRGIPGRNRAWPREGGAPLRDIGVRQNKGTVE